MSDDNQKAPPEEKNDNLENEQVEQNRFSTMLTSMKQKLRESVVLQNLLTEVKKSPILYSFLLLLFILICILTVGLFSAVHKINEQSLLTNYAMADELFQEMQKQQLKQKASTLLNEFESLLKDSEVSDIDSVAISKKVQKLMELEKTLKELRNTGERVNRLIFDNNSDYYLKIHNFFEQGNTFGVTKEEMKIILRYVLSNDEQLVQERFNVLNFDINNDSIQEVFLLDQALGNVWHLNSKYTNFEKIEIENLSVERKNSEKDKLIDMIVRKTGGFEWDFGKKREVVGHYDSTLLLLPQVKSSKGKLVNPSQ